VCGVGVETVGTDAGTAHSFDPPFPCHSFLLGAGKFGLTQLRNLDRLPPTGGTAHRGTAADRRRVRQPVPGPGAGRDGLMLVAEAVGRSLAALGVAHVFGVVGSGNFHVTNALVAGGARFVAARHEGGAATMADACARVSGSVTALSVHQGCGLTNAMTGITEAAKSRTPMLVLAAEATTSRSNFAVDQDALAAAVGAVPERVRSAATVADDVERAYRVAAHERRTVLLNLPLDVQAETCESLRPVEAGARRSRRLPTRPGSMRSPGCSRARRDRSSSPGAARSAPVRRSRLSPSAAEHCSRRRRWRRVCSTATRGRSTSPGASRRRWRPSSSRPPTVVVGIGCALNMWTMRHGRLIGPGARVVQVDVDADAIGAHRAVDLGIVGDAAAVARAVAPLVGPRSGWRDEKVRDRIRRELRWRDVPYDDTSATG
jgi:hypothetical protein